MKTPWILYVGIGSTAAPLLASIVGRRRLTTPRFWTVGWCAFLLIANLGAMMLARQGHNNHWLNYIMTPLASGIALWALSLLQVSSVARLSLRLMVPLLGIAWVAMVALIERTDTFSLVAEPFAGLLILGAAIYTLVSRTARESGALTGQDWLWIALGLALYSGAAIALPPTAYWLLTRAPNLLVRAYEVKALFEIVAFLAIARGLTCPMPTTRSGGSSSRASSRWRSSSPASS